jgi:FdhD protein
MDEVDQIVLPPGARLTQSTVYRIVETIRTQQSVYKQAGSVHGCALFSNTGELLWFVEDVGRHNAVDAIAGLMWLEGMAGADKVFYTTGRLTSEMVIKGAQMGIPFLLSRSGTTEMGHRVAEKVGMSLLARCSGRHFLLLAGQERLVFEPEVLEALESQLRRPREGGDPILPASTQLTQNLGAAVPGALPPLRGNDAV